MKDVAAEAGVSLGTVSNVLNRPEKVSARTREQVQSAIDRLGFVRNDAARQLRSGANQSVGMIVLDVGNPFFTDLAQSAETRLGELHRPLILGSSGQDPVREANCLDLFESQRVSGVLISPVGQVQERLRQLRRRGIAVVVVDRRLGSGEFPSVGVDDLLGARLAVTHLVQGGRRRIAFVGGSPELSQVRRRLAGAQAAAAESGLDATVEAICTDTLDATAGRRAVEALLDRSPSRRPDAIFAANDLLALGVLQGLTLAGVAVPDEMAVVGYDDIEFASSAAIPLTSVRQPRDALGQVAADLLLEHIADPDVEPREVILEPELMIRLSSTTRSG
ncbi:LacI family DNA-binding transcriptional regulator [Naumannella halotolerans]|uniref:LacI family transcriptional regulator n=1 Tax=Naumannella halotolerans TaxID=993414 RepID=A0A4R7J6C0_9ACTN|nr:LacI family DNA-binding transcriptional regulator [Naumannella halotolerans]TDT32931.1 LacI family transcriptional regulator [Naumannella halotolerans]